MQKKQQHSKRDESHNGKKQIKNEGGKEKIRTTFGSGKKRTDKMERKKGMPKWKNVVAEIEQLEARIKEEVPPSGCLYYKYKPKEEATEDRKTNQVTENKMTNRKVIETEDKSKVKIRFSDLPISRSTTTGLFKSKFVKMTEVQRASITHALAGRDIVCCARTGSGKTLAYLIPVVEKLYKLRWSAMDGLGALVLVPTRELGIQAFEVLRSFAGFHDMSAALIIGGKDLIEEQQHIKTMNIVIATPGRLLQHMDETSQFVYDNLKILVMDEVDRMLDMGFRNDVDQIMQNLPSKVQNLLYSATIGRSVKDLARLKLKRDHEYIQIHDFDQMESRANGEQDVDGVTDSKLKQITPTTLLHYYMVVQCHEKLDMLFSFLKSHAKLKCLVFFSSRKQVRFAYQALKTLKVCQNLFEFHGKQDQNKRTAIYFQFVEKKQAILLCTDIAARGIDFPAVDWVVQVDIPEDVATYVHRVGRTARYKAKGNALMFLMPSEEQFINKLQQRQISLKKLSSKSSAQLTIQPVLEKMNAENKDLQHLAKRSVVSYLRSVHLMKDKSIFKVNEIDREKLARSYGLLNAPTIEIVSRKDKVDRVAMLREQAQARKMAKQLANEMEQPGSSDNEESEDEDDFFIKTKNTREISEGEEEEIVAVSNQKVSKNKLRKIKPEGPFDGRNVTVFTADGKQMSKDEFERKRYLDSLKGKITIQNESEVSSDDADEQKEYIKKVRKNLDLNQVVDTKLAREKLTEKRLKQKRRLREQDGERPSKSEFKLGSGDESDQQQDDEIESSEGPYQPSSDERQQSDSESSEEIVVPPPKKRQKVENAEEKVLALLKKKSLF